MRHLLSFMTVFVLKCTKTTWSTRSLLQHYFSGFSSTKNTDLITSCYPVEVSISQCARTECIYIYPHISLLDLAKGSINILSLQNKNKWQK